MTDARYWPTLDGIRAGAIAAVIAYHLGDFGGGWLGVDVFFVLSGYLITTLLLEEHQKAGRVRLRAFWARRAKRLLPAVLLLLLVVAAFARAGRAGLIAPQLRGPSLATLFYVANWQQIISGHGYFAQFAAPNPLLHTWSLAIEEQYYLLWPLLFLLLLRMVRGSRRWLAVTVAALVVISATWMGVAEHLFGVNRAYLGTDTRAWELLLGGVAAVLLPPVQSGSPRSTRRWSALTVVGIGGVAAGMALADGPPQWIWDGGAVVICLCVVAVVVGSIRAPAGPVGRLLSIRPLRWIGRISYSLYLWHWPVIVLITGRSGLPLLGARLGVMTGAACLSYYLVERPLRTAAWHSWRWRALVPVAVAGTAAVLLAATLTPAQAGTTAVNPTGASQGFALVAHPASVVAVPLPLRVWILGDSVMYDGSLGVGAALEATGEAAVVVNSSFGGWGLTTDHLWPADAAQIVARSHPNVVIGTWSWDDPAAAADPSGYGRRLQAAVGDLLGDGVQLVVLLQFPQTGPAPALTDPARRAAAFAKQTSQQDVWDRAAAAAVRAYPGRAVYLTTDAVFAPGGRFKTWLPTADGQWLRARKVDNTHMCPYGATLLGALVVADLAPGLRLAAMRPGWEAGAWTRDPRYDDPPGACPNDQPPERYTGVPVG